MPYIVRPAFFTVRELLPKEPLLGFRHSYEAWFSKKILSGSGVNQKYSLEDLVSRSITVVAVITPDVLLPECATEIDRKIRNAGYSRRIIFFSPLNIKYPDRAEIKGACYFKTENVSEVIKCIWKYSSTRFF